MMKLENLSDTPQKTRYGRFQLFVYVQLHVRYPQLSSRNPEKFKERYKYERDIRPEVVCRGRASPGLLLPIEKVHSGDCRKGKCLPPNELTRMQFDYPSDSQL